MITVFGATGRVGSKVVELLLQAGESVRALGRSTQKLAALEQRGASIIAGEAGDADYLSHAFAGSDAAFIVMPHDAGAPDYRAEQDLIGTSLAAALSHAAVPHVVFLSSIGADQAEGTGVLTSLYRQERRLERLAKSNVLMLRASWFYENVLESLPLIKEQGIVADAIDPELRMPVIATQDIARIATRALIARDWKGVQMQEISGPRDLTYRAIVDVLRQKLSRPDLAYVQMPYEDMIGALVQAGFSRDVAIQYVGLSRGLNEGRVAARDAHGPRHIGETTFESFADDIAIAYRHLA